VSVRVAREFASAQGGWECFFGTSYSFEFELFDEYLFRRLGDPPVNATVLCDFDHLARRLAELGPDDVRLLQRANRDYLLRAVDLGGTFHPKTYFFGSKRRGVLLVGSGNLSIRGIEQGYEVFCRFVSESDRELATIRGWRDWVDELVARIDDQELTHRWLDVKDRTLDWLVGSSDGSELVTNLERSMLAQLAERAAPPVDELHALAPFYDRNARAFAQLVERIRPKRLFLYLGGGTSVDGSVLASVLDGVSGQVEVLAYEPHEFVHAKLVGLVKGEAGMLLSGSANLSNAAFTASLADEHWANIEAGVLANTSADVVRAAFRHPNLELASRGLEAIQILEYRTDEAEVARQRLRLLAARRDDKGRVSVTYAGVDEAGLFVSTGSDLYELAEGVTTGAVLLAEGGALVWLAEASGERVSNKVLLDDPAQLLRWLDERKHGSDRPSGLDPLDLHQPVGQLLMRLNEQCIFDIDDTRAAARVRRLVSEESDTETADWSFADELAREELRLDPRVDHYRHAGSGLPLDDEILVLLQLMLDKAPAERGLHLVRLPIGPGDESNDGPRQGTAWSMDKRIELRVFNVLSRWCGALADPRFVWIGHSAPVRNYVALLTGLAACWEEDLLPPDRVKRLLETLFGSFVQAERTPGYLIRLDDEARADALSRLPGEGRALAASLCFSVLREKADWREWIFRFQPFLPAAIELGILEVNEQTLGLVERLVDEAPSSAEVEERLLFAATYLDDPHWCKKQEQELGVECVSLTHVGFNHKFGITLATSGLSLDDVRLVSLVRQALAYRRVSGAVVDLGGDRLAVHLGEPVRATLHGNFLETTHSYDAAGLAELERLGIGFASLLTSAGALAS
jgi:hypothetical protein